jgi:hypothetical protein
MTLPKKKNMEKLKYKKLFWQTIAGILTTCILVFTLAFCYIFYEKELNDERFYTSDYYDTELTSHIWYHNSDDNGQGYIFNCETGEKTLKGVSWIALSEDGDEFAVFSTGRKRGYFNIYTGKAVIPAQYTKAWIFSEGIAAVSKNDSLFFIDHSGEKVFKHGFALPGKTRSFCFHNGYCQLTNKAGKTGLIDKNGKWVLLPEYDQLAHEGRNYWSVCKEGRWGVFSDSLVEILACEYEMVTVSEDNGIYVSLADHTQKRYDYTGKVLNDFICGSVDQLSFDTGTYDEEGNPVMATAICRTYAVETGYYGLMDSGGRPVTPPLYKNIEAIGKNIYRCSYDYQGTFSILVNSKGIPVSGI